MPLYAMLAEDKPGAFEHRQAVRPRHLEHLDRLGGKLVLAGPFQGEDGRSTGSFVVVEADNLEAARALFGADPFVTEGVFGAFEVSRFALTINNTAEQ